MELPSMPVLRYFFFVGAALLALLFISDLYFPGLPASVVSADGGNERAEIRINSDRKWPERIEFDTRVRAAPLVTVEAVPAVAAPEKARAREAFAQLPSPDVGQSPLPVTKKPELKPQRLRKIAKRRADPSVMVVAQRPAQFGLFGNTW
jgi:hypothetical protein